MNNIIDNNPLISFIVPIFNVEKYIRRCISSIMDQSYNNIEIILVDDGSPDNSGSICDSLAAVDQRIKVVHQMNCGVSTARNKGLSIAAGEYVVFVDGDDFVEIDYAEYFLGLIGANIEMAVGLDNFTVYSTQRSNGIYRDTWSDLDVIEGIYLGKIDVAVWNKCYKKSILDDNKIWFNSSIWYGEGMLFNIEYLQHVDRIAVGDKKVYHQVFNSNSAMRSFNLKSNFCGIRSMQIQKTKWKKVTPEIEQAWKYHYRNFAVNIICGLVSSGMVNSEQDLYKKCKKAMRKNILLPWKINISIKQKVWLTIFSVIPYIVALRSSAKARKAAILQNKLLQ